MRSLFILLALTLGLTGCASPSKVDTTKTTNVKRVAIVDFPELKTYALVGELILPIEAQHFTDKQSPYFDQTKTKTEIDIPELSKEVGFAVVNDMIINNNMSVMQSGATGAVAGLTAAIIESAGNDSNEKAANFNELFDEAHPQLSFRRDYINALREQFESKGIEVVLVTDQSTSSPYLRWQAIDKEGNPIAQTFPHDLPTVDADLILQVSPVAIFNAGSVLNAYSRVVSVGVAVFDAQTKEFHGTQTFFKWKDNLSGHHSYDGLVGDIDEVGLKLHELLLSTAPEVSALITN